jgi:orotate phosphoribosyltransferase
MEQYQKDFISFIIDIGALKFGEFTLKSGRISPYFFNAGAFNTGEHIAKLGDFYANAIQSYKLDFDVLFGPAYKGIPLATSVAIALNNTFNKNVAYSFNRKEAKKHGEGGNIVGAELKGDILIIDDVITAGTAILESIDIINNNNAKVKNALVMLDRQERGRSKESAIQELENKFNIKIFSIINLSHLINYLKQDFDKDLVKRIEAYNKLYSINQ